jgi:3-methyl-2-oxobutanoate hydroxymethyltransferase
MEGINVLLVGDSLGMTVQGHDSTLPVTVDDIAYHVSASQAPPSSLTILAPARITTAAFSKVCSGVA